MKMYCIAVISGIAIWLAGTTSTLAADASACFALMNTGALQASRSMTLTQHDVDEFHRLRQTIGSRSGTDVGLGYEGIEFNLASNHARSEDKEQVGNTIQRNRTFTLSSAPAIQLAQSVVDCMKAEKRASLIIEPRLSGPAAMSVQIKTRSETDQSALTGVFVDQTVEFPGMADGNSLVHCYAKPDDQEYQEVTGVKNLKMTIGVYTHGGANHSLLVRCQRSPTTASNDPTHTRRYLPTVVTFQFASHEQTAYVFNWPGAGIPSIVRLEDLEKQLAALRADQGKIRLTWHQRPVTWLGFSQIKRHVGQPQKVKVSLREPSLVTAFAELVLGQGVTVGATVLRTEHTRWQVDEQVPSCAKTQSGISAGPHTSTPSSVTICNVLLEPGEHTLTLDAGIQIWEPQFTPLATAETYARYYVYSVPVLDVGANMEKNEVSM